jgi:thioredoxin 1
MTHTITNSNYKQTLEENKIVVLDFWASWCPPCKAFGPIFEQWSETRSDVLCGKVNTDEESEIAKAEGIKNIPTIIFYKEGKLIKKNVGGLSLEELDSIIASL